MATIPDITLSNTVYVNVYSLTGIVLGTPVTVQNKTSAPVYLQNIAAQPAGGSANGFVLLPNEFISLTGTIVGLWARGNGKIAVEVIT